MSVFFKLGPDEDSTIAFEPEWDFKNSAAKLEKKHRLQNGALYTYKTGDYAKIQLKQKFFPVSDAMTVNSWWKSNTKLQFYYRRDDKLDYTFQGTDDGWMGWQGTITASDNGILTYEVDSGATNPYIQSGSLSFQGSEFYKIRLRVKRIAGADWDGRVFYKTVGVNSHTYLSSYYLDKTVPAGLDNDYVVVEWDMRSLDQGGDDWVSSKISQFRIDLSLTGSGSFEVDYIDVGHRYTEVHSVMVRGTRPPFDKYQKPYADLMKGTIKLEGY